MVYDRNDRWLYKPLSYETERLCSRFVCDRSNKTEVKEVKFSPETTKESGARSVSISHRSDGKNSYDYYHSRAEQKNKTVTEKHCRVVDDGTMPYGWRNRFFDDELWNLRTPFLRAHQLSLKPW